MAIKGKARWLLDNTSSLLWSALSLFFALFLFLSTTPHTHFFLACFIPCTTVHFCAVSLSPEGQWVCSCCFYSQSYGWVCTWRRTTTLWCGHMCYSCIAQPSVALVLAGLASIYPGPSWLHCDPLTTAALKWHLAMCSGSHMRVSEGRRWWFDLQNKKTKTFLFKCFLDLTVCSNEYCSLSWKIFFNFHVEKYKCVSHSLPEFLSYSFLQ